MKTKTMKYTTLKGLVSKTQQFNFNTFISGRMYHHKQGWVKYKITEELRTEIEDLFKDVVGDVWLYGVSSCGLLDRLIISKRSLKAQYIGGQDYPSEMRYLRKLFRGA